MELLTKKLLARFEKIGKQDKEDALVIAKFFNPTGRGTWYATEYDEKEEIFFGYVSIFGDWNDEFGSFSLEELTRYQGAFGLSIERDRFFKEKHISECGIASLKTYATT